MTKPATKALLLPLSCIVSASADAKKGEMDDIVGIEKQMASTDASWIVGCVEDEGIIAGACVASRCVLAGEAISRKTLINISYQIM